MAGDYLPIRLDLPDDPAVIQMAAALEISEDDVVGRLVRTWAWFNRHSANGHAPGVTLSWLDRYTATPGWSEAMAQAGWLIIEAAGLTIPAYDTWNTEAAKKRLQERDRKRKQRAKEAWSREHEDIIPPEVQQPSKTCPAQHVTYAGPHNTTETGTSTETGKKRSDLIEVSWKSKDFPLQVVAIAKEHFRGEPFLDHTRDYSEEYRRDLLAIAAIHATGLVRPQWFHASIDALRALHQTKGVKSPIQCLKAIMADKWPPAATTRFGPFYKALHHVAQSVPADLIAK